MRIARVAHVGGMSFGVVDGDSEGPAGLTVAEVDGHPFSDIRLTGRRWPLADVRLLSPILPSKVVCVGRNYADHAAEHGGEVPPEPLLFLKPSTAVVGPHDAVKLPPESDRVEHEAELAVVIGAPGARRVPPDQALASVLGYTCANDVTARDLQRRDGQWTRAKGFDSFCPLGPWIETEFDLTAADIRCAVNGELRQHGQAADMVFDVATLISYVSEVMTLLPGDVLLTGTPAGVGPLTHGDTVAVTVTGVGTLTNQVVNLD